MLKKIKFLVFFAIGPTLSYGAERAAVAEDPPSRRIMPSAMQSALLAEAATVAARAIAAREAAAVGEESEADAGSGNTWEEHAEYVKTRLQQASLQQVNDDTPVAVDVLIAASAYESARRAKNTGLGSAAVEVVAIGTGGGISASAAPAHESAPSSGASRAAAGPST